MMKRMLCTILACLLIGSLCACAAGTGDVDMPAAAAPMETPAQTAESAPEADYAALSNILLRIFTDYLPGTAGCSLQAAKLAGELLDWDARNASDATKLTETMQSVVASLPTDASTQYAEQFDGVRGAANELCKDSGLEYLETAGYTPEAYPYDAVRVEALLTALGAALPEGTGMPAETGSFLLAVDPASPIAIDVDGDGVMESVTVAVDEDQYTTDVAIAGEGKLFTDHRDSALMFLSAYVCDAWQGDGSQALILCGDEASDDYETVVYRVRDGKLARAEVFGSLRDADANGILTIETHIDVFGTYSGTCRYQLNDDFTFSLCSPYTVARYDGDVNDRKLTVICDNLPVILQDGTSEAATLPKGTELMLAETDQQSYAVLTDGSAYYKVDIARRVDDWQWYLNGVPEDECFSPLLYAG